MFFHRYEKLWMTYFSELGIETLLSPKTDKSILETGSRYGIDEACLSSKLLWGHVDSLVGKCDLVFIPRYANLGDDGVFCTRFEALYEMAKNSFRDAPVRFITADIDVNEGIPEAAAFGKLAMELGKKESDGLLAYESANRAWLDDQKKRDADTCRLLKQDGVKVLVVGHSYNIHDEYIGIPVIETLRSLDVIPILSTDIDLTDARARYQSIAKNVPWIVNRELLGCIDRFRDEVDGIVLITAFPCGPDSMTNDMVIRRVKGKPILNLLLDSQDGTAGIDTRLESFTDIIKMRKKQ